MWSYKWTFATMKTWAVDGFKCVEEYLEWFIQTPTHRPPQKFGKSWHGKIKILSWFSFLNSLERVICQWKLKSKCKNHSNFHHLFVFYSKDFLVHNVIWLFNVVCILLVLYLLDILKYLWYCMVKHQNLEKFPNF